jgi:ubiquinone/menaquinone biosynthesis C-methylase UbiE
MAAKTSKGYKGIGMEGFIATWYAKITAKNIEGFRQEAKQISERVPQGGAVLEVAPGPGYLAIELAKLGKQNVTGLDISKKFVEIARAKALESGVAVDFRQGDVAHMPFGDNGFDFVTCRAAFKNFAEPVQALNEIYRVLKPGGKASIVDLRGNVTKEALDKHVTEELHLTGLNLLLTKWIFRTTLIKRAYTTEQFRAFVAQSHFKTCEIREDAIGLEVMLEK